MIILIKNDLILLNFNIKLVAVDLFFFKILSHIIQKQINNKQMAKSYFIKSTALVKASAIPATFFPPAVAKNGCPPPPP